jgi:small subunit ribosomal protein S2
VDTNSDPTQVDFPIPANDDATKSIALITRAIMDAVAQGLEERKYDKDSAEDVATEEVAADAPAVAVEAAAEAPAEEPAEAPATAESAEATEENPAL